MFTYSPPGGADDLAGRSTRDAFLQDWHDFIYGQFSANINSLGSQPLFFSEKDSVAQSPPIPIGWNAFPLRISRVATTRAAAWAEADKLGTTDVYTPNGAPKVHTSYRPQDEYCEWHAYKRDGKLERIVFTAEGPEYWLQLAKHDFATVLKFYHDNVDTSVQDQDLRLAQPIAYGDEELPAGSYNPFNKWNTTDGVVHLTHRANTLGAEINLAAFATVPHKDHNGQRVDDVRRLICCAGYGNANRSSDPSIGFAVNTTCVPLTSGGALQRATLADPVGLYMKGLQAGTLTGPNGENLDNWFRVVRGGPGAGLMAILAPPAGATFGLDKVKVKNVALQFGGQVAEAIDMVLYARTSPYSGGAPSLQSCDHDCCMPAGTPASKIKSINLGQIDRGNDCGSGGTPAYPELAPPAPALGGSLLTVAKKILLGGSPKVSTRLGDD